MSEAELKESLITTLRYLLKSKGDIELQVVRAKEIIKLSCEQSDAGEMSPISIEEDAVWLKYLLGLLGQVKSDVAGVKKALLQLGVSNLELLVSNLENMNSISKSQGDYSLDFSSCIEK